jgi:hypothetical protein
MLVYAFCHLNLTCRSYCEYLRHVKFKFRLAGGRSHPESACSENVHTEFATIDDLI